MRHNITSLTLSCLLACTLLGAVPACAEDVTEPATTEIVVLPDQLPNQGGHHYTFEELLAMTKEEICAESDEMAAAYAFAEGEAKFNYNNIFGGISFVLKDPESLPPTRYVEYDFDAKFREITKLPDEYIRSVNVPAFSDGKYVNGWMRVDLDLSKCPYDYTMDEVLTRAYISFLTNPLMEQAYLPPTAGPAPETTETTTAETTMTETTTATETAASTTQTETQTETAATTTTASAASTTQTTTTTTKATTQASSPKTSGHGVGTMLCLLLSAGGCLLTRRPKQ